MPRFDQESMVLLLGEWCPVWREAKFLTRMQWVQGSIYYLHIVESAQLDQYDQTDLAATIAASELHLTPATFRVELVAKLMKEQAARKEAACQAKTK